MKNQKLVFMAQQAQLGPPAPPRGNIASKEAGRERSSPARQEDYPRGKIKNGVLVQRQVDFRVMGERKVPQEKSKKRMVEKSARSPKRQMADLEHTMSNNRYLHETKIQGDEGTDSHVTSLRQPLDQAHFQHAEQLNLSEKKEKEGGGEVVYEGETRNVQINSTEVQTMTPDIIEQHSGQPTPLTTRMNKDENFQVDMGQPYPMTKDQQVQEGGQFDTQIILQNDGQQRLVINSNLNSMQRSSDSKSPIVSGNEDIILKIGQNCYSPNVLSLKTDHDRQHFAPKSPHQADSRLASLLHGNNQSSNNSPENKDMDSYYQKARREHYNLQSVEKAKKQRSFDHQQVSSQPHGTPATIDLSSMNLNDNQDTMGRRNINSANSSKQQASGADYQDQLHQIPTHQIAKIQVKKKAQIETPRKTRQTRTKKVTPSFALIELEHTRDLVISNNSNAYQNEHKTQNQRNSSLPRTPLLSSQLMSSNQNYNYHPPIIVSANQSIYSPFFGSDRSEGSSLVPILTPSGEVLPARPLVSKLNWSYALQANEAATAMPHSNHAAIIEQLKREARKQILRDGGHVVDTKDLQVRREQAREKKRKAEEKKLKNEGDSDGIDLSNDPSLKDLFVEWNELKARIDEERVKEAEANNQRRRKQSKQPKEPEEQKKPAKAIGPRRGTVVVKRGESSQMQDYEDDQEKRRQEADKAISMTSSKLPFETNAVRSKKDDNNKQSVEAETIVVDQKSKSNEAGACVLSDFMSYQARQGMTNSKLSNFSPKSMENTRKRAGITTPNNQNEHNMIDIGREMFSLEKQGKQKSRGRQLTPLDVKMSQKEEESEGTAENKPSHRGQGVFFKKTHNTVEQSPTPIEGSDRGGMHQPVLIQSKFSETVNNKTEDLNSPFLASEAQANTLRPATRPTVTDSHMQMIVSPQRSSFEKERKTVTLNKINLQDQLSDIISNNALPQAMHININAESKSTPRANDPFESSMVHMSKIEKRKQVANQNIDTIDKITKLHQNEDTNELLCSSLRDVHHQFVGSQPGMTPDLPEDAADRCNSSYVSIEQKIGDFPGLIPKTALNQRGLSEFVNNELLLQQGLLQMNQEKQEQMFRNIQLMQQSLQDKEGQRSKRLRGATNQNQDIPLQHNQSSTSNQIKSNILQHYLQVPSRMNNKNGASPTVAEEFHMQITNVMQQSASETNNTATSLTNQAQLIINNAHAISDFAAADIKSLESLGIDQRTLPKRTQLFNELDIHQKILIQKQLQKLYERFQLRNMNAHFRKQKMPFSHFRHPNHQSQFENMDYGGSRKGAQSFPRARPSIKKMLAKELLLAASGSKAAPQDPQLQLTLNMEEGLRKQTPMTTLSLSNEQKENDPLKPNSIIPAPKVQQANQTVDVFQESPKRGLHEEAGTKISEPLMNDIGMPDRFQNRLIKNKMQQRMDIVEGDTPLPPAWENSDGDNARSVSLGAQLTARLSDQGSKREHVRSNKVAMEYEDPKSPDELQSNIDLMNYQMKNLVDIYNKNKVILRQMKEKTANQARTQVQRKSIHLHGESPRSTNNDSGVSDLFGYIGYKANQSLSPIQQQLMKKEQEILNKQDELRNTLLQNQKKNLQIQQRLQQKIYLSKQQMNVFLSKRSFTKAHLEVDRELQGQMSTVNRVIHNLDKSGARLLKRTSPVMMRQQSRPTTNEKSREQQRSIQVTLVQNKQRKVKILESIYKKLDQLNSTSTAEQIQQIKLKPKTKIVSAHHYSSSPITTPRTSPRLDMLTSRVQQLAKENSNFDLYINESSPQPLKLGRDQETQYHKLTNSKNMLKPLHVSKDYKKQLNENFMQTSPFDGAYSEKGTQSSQDKKNKIYENYQLTRQGQLVEDIKRQAIQKPKIVMNKFKEEHAIGLKVKTSQRQSHVIADDLEREFQKQQTRGDPSPDFEEGEFNDNIQSQHQAYEDNNVLSAKTVGSNAQINGPNQHDEEFKDADDTKEKLEQEGSEAGDKGADSTSIAENQLYNQDINTAEESARCRVVEAKHVNVKIGQSFGSQHYDSGGVTNLDAEESSPEHTPLLYQQRDQADMVKSTDDAFLSPSIEAKEISISEQILLHKSELENITTYVAQKGRTVFQQFKSILEEQTPQKVRNLFKDINSMLASDSKGSPDLQIPDGLDQSMIEIIGEPVRIDDQVVLNAEHTVRLKMIKDLEKTLRKIQKSSKAENQKPKGRDRSDEGHFRRSKDRHKDAPSAMTHFGDTPKSSQENLHPKGIKTRAKVASKESSIISFTARAPSDLDQKHAMKTTSTSPRPSQFPTMAEYASMSFKSITGRMEMEQFMKNFLSYYKDLKSIEKLRIMFSSSKGAPRSPRKPLDPSQTMLFESVLEDLQKLLLIDIQSMLDLTSEDIKQTLLDREQSEPPQKKSKKEIKFVQMDTDMKYLAQKHIAEKTLNIDLFFKQRQKTQSDIYIRHLQGLMDNMKREREHEIKTHQQELIKQGKLLGSDIDSTPQHPKIPLELELNEEQLLFGQIESIKNFDGDMTISNKEKDELRAQFKELKFRKLLEKREQRVNEELSEGSTTRREQSLNRATPKPSRDTTQDAADGDGPCELEHVLSDQEKSPPQGIAQDSRCTPPFQDNILTNESLQKLLKQKSTTRPNEMHNGYEMSVQKLAKVSSIEQDSIYSALPYNPNINLNQPSVCQHQQTEVNQNTLDSKQSDTKQILNNKDKLKAKQAAVGNLTAPGGDRQRLKKLRVGAAADNTKRNDQITGNHHATPQPSAPTTAIGLKKPRRSNQPERREQQSGLIQRGNLRFKGILQFESKTIKKSDVSDYEDNERLHDIRKNYQDAIAQMSAQQPVVSRTPITATSQQSKNLSFFETKSKSICAPDSMQMTMQNFRSTGLNSAANSSLTRSVFKTQNKQLVQDFKKTMMKRSQLNGQAQRPHHQIEAPCLDESSLLSYGDRILKVRKKQGGDKEDQDYISFIQSGQPLLPALKTALSEQMRQNVGEKEKARKQQRAAEAAAADEGDDQKEKQPLTEKEKEQMEQKKEKIRGLQDANQFQLDLYYQKLEMLDKLEVPSVLQGKSTEMTMKDVVQTNINNLVNGAPIFKNSREPRDGKHKEGVANILSGRKQSVPLRADGALLGFSTADKQSSGQLYGQDQGKEDSYKQLYFEQVMGRSSRHANQRLSTLRDDLTVSKMKGSMMDRTSGSTLVKQSHGPFGLSENFSIQKGTHAVQKSEQVDVDEEPRSKFVKEVRVLESQKTSVMPQPSVWHNSKNISDELDMRAIQLYKKAEATDRSPFDGSNMNETSLLQAHKQQHTLDYLPLSKHKRFQSVNTRSHEKRAMFESSKLDSAEGSRLRRYDDMIKQMQSKQLSKVNQKIKVKGHLRQYDALTQQQMVKSVPKTRDYKQERANMLHERFNPEFIKQQEKMAKEQQRKEQQQVFDYFKSNLEKLEL